MNIVTVCDASWTQNHLLRFVKLTKRAMPDAVIHLILVSNTDVPDKQGIMQMVTRCEIVEPKKNADEQRDYYNAVRLEAGQLFGLDEYLYMDTDVDVYASLHEIPEISEKPLAWCRSPTINEDWAAVCKIYGWEPDPMANNGLLYIRQNQFLEYQIAVDELSKMVVQPRTRGMLAFNVMLRKNPELHVELPYPFGVIWWDTKTMVTNTQTGEQISAFTVAKTLHYCSDEGKKARAQKDMLWFY